MSAPEPASVTVPCMAGGMPNPWAAGNGHGWTPEPIRCRHAEARAQTPLDRPSDFYINPRHGARCDCCGQDGRHTIYEGTTPEQLPACLRQYPGLLVRAVFAASRGETPVEEGGEGDE